MLYNASVKRAYEAHAHTHTHTHTFFLRQRWSILGDYDKEYIYSSSIVFIKAGLKLLLFLCFVSLHASSLDLPVTEAHRPGLSWRRLGCLKRAVPEKELCGGVGSERACGGRLKFHWWVGEGGGKVVWGGVAGINHRPGLLSWLVMRVWMSLDVAKQQAKLGTATARQSRQLPGKASFMVWHTHTHTHTGKHAHRCTHT